MTAVASKIREPTPYSTEAAIARPHRGSKAGRFLAQTKATLTEHCGGNPTAVQRILIERTAMVMLRLELMDARSLDGRDAELTERESRHYLAWANTAKRMLDSLGAAKPPPKRNVVDLLR